MDFKPKAPFPVSDIGAWIGFSAAVIAALFLVKMAKKLPVVGSLIDKVA